MSLFASISPLDTVKEPKMQEIKGTKLERVGWTVKITPLISLLDPIAFVLGLCLILFFYVYST